MCVTCGCGEDAGVRVTLLAGAAAAVDSGARSGAYPHDHEDLDAHEHGHEHEHEHEHDHGHRHDVEHEQQHLDHPGRTILLEQQILAKNDLLAAHNRGWLAGRRVLAVNLMSSPGSGKTTLLERTIRDLGDELQVSVIEGDQETPLDAQRIEAAGRPVVQVNTGAGCHLDADMVSHALQALDPQPGATMFIENVGNLVCPAMFDLGEAGRVVVASVTEGADKPLKYPYMFRDADLVVVNKVDLAPYVDFDLGTFTAAVHLVHPDVEVITVSATKGTGLEDWYGWLRAMRSSMGADGRDSRACDLPRVNG